MIAFDLITGDLVAMEEDDIIVEEEEEIGRTMARNSLCCRRKKYQECKSCKEAICWESGGGCGGMVCDNCALSTCGFCIARFVQMI